MSEEAGTYQAQAYPAPAAPTVGRIVHYNDGAGECRAALVTGAGGSEPYRIHITVFFPDLPDERRIATWGSAVGSWHWPGIGRPCDA